MKKILLSLFLAFLSLSACQQNAKELAALRSENATLKKENEELKKKYDEIVNGASRLIMLADTHYRNNEYNDAKSVLMTLLEKHPTAPESTRGKQLLEEVNARLERQALEVAEKDKILKDEEKKRLETATSKMRKSSDDVEGITWYYDKSTPKYEDNNSFHIYIGKKAGYSPWLRLVVRYSADDWLFVRSFIVVSDDNRFESGPVEFKRDNVSGSIWEWYDTRLTAKELQWVQAVIRGKKNLIRYQGDTYHQDRNISSPEKQALQNVLDAFIALGGSLPE